MPTSTKPISVAWCTDASGTVAFDADIISALHDMTTATSARLRWVDTLGWVGTAGATVYWAMTLKAGAPVTTGKATFEHLLVTGDAVTAMIGQSIKAHVWCTLSGIERPDVADPFYIPVVE